MSHIFISYSRKDRDYVLEICKALKAKGFKVWIDEQKILKGEDWEQTIYRAIEEADAFLFMISGASVASSMCNKEIACAVENQKRILPVFIDRKEVDPVMENFLGEEQKEEIRQRQFSFCRPEQDDFDSALEAISQAVRTDYEWVQYHNTLQNKALEWQRRNDQNRLLRGDELREAEEQFARVGNTQDPQATELQRQYILISRRKEVQQRRQITTILGVGLIIFAGLAVFAWGQRNNALTSEATAIAEANAKATALVKEESARATAQAEKERAEEQAQLALSRQLAAQSSARLESNIDLALLLSVEAYHAMPSLEAKKSLLAALQQYPHLKGFLRNHNSAVRGIQFRADDKTLITVSEDGNVTVWDTTSNRVASEFFLDYPATLTSVAISPDGQRLAAGHEDGAITIWDLSGPSPSNIVLHAGFNAAIQAMSFRPDHAEFVSWDRDFHLLVWDLTNQSIIDQVTITEWIPDVQESLAVFDVGAGILALGGCMQYESGEVHCNDANEVLLWSIAEHQLLGRLPIEQMQGTWSMAFSPDGSLLATGGCTELSAAVCLTGQVGLWRISDQQLLGTGLTHASYLGFNGNDIYSLAFNAEGTTLAGGLSNGDVFIWELSTGEDGHVTGMVRQQGLQSQNTDAETIDALAFSADGKTLVTGSKDGMVILWDARYPDNWQFPFDDPLAKFFVGAEGGVMAATLSPSGLLAAATCQPPPGEYSCSSEGVIDVYMWDISTGDKVGQFASGQVGGIGDLLFSPNGQILAVVGSDYQTILLLDAMTGKQIGKKVAKPVAKSIDGALINRVLQFSPNGQYLAFTGETESQVTLWDIENQIPVGEFSGSGSEGRITALAFSPDGKYLVSGSCDEEANYVCIRGNLHVWEVATRKEIAQMTHGEYVSSVAFSPDGSLIASAVEENLILWDAESYRRLAQFNVGGSVYGVGNLSFSPDGKLIAMDLGGALFPKAYANRVVLWDISERQALADFWNGWVNLNPPTRITIDTTGTKLVTKTDFTAVLWDIDAQSWIARACYRASRNLSYAEWKLYFPDVPYRATCADIPLEPREIMLEADTHALAGNSRMAIASFSHAVQWAIAGDDAATSNAICWFGSIDGFAQIVLPACEHAVQLAPEIGAIRDSRGVARALTGDFEGAIDDFKFTVNLLNKECLEAEKALCEQYSIERQNWIAQLESGQNPFDTNTLMALRDQ